MSRVVVILSGFLILTVGCAREDNGYNTIAQCGSAPEVFVSQVAGGSQPLEIGLAYSTGRRGASPSFAIWAAYPDDRYQSIYATCKSAKNSWDGPDDPSESLPIWTGVRILEGLNNDGGQIDAITTATPTRPEFWIQWSPEKMMPTDTLNLFIEANLPYDYNDFYQAEAGPNGQPSILYRIQFIQKEDSLELLGSPKIIGHGHPKGLDHKIYQNRTGLTTVLNLFKRISAK